MKILTWNINGIRACKIPLHELFRNLDADVICLQETKITRDQLDSDLVDVENYNAYFSFSKKRSGYSGVATYCRNSHTPVVAEEGLTGLLATGTKQTASVIGHYGDQTSFSDEELQALDAEGRTIITQQTYRKQDGTLGELVIINVYCPRADLDNAERVSYKMRFYRVLQLRAEALLQAGKSVVIVGDVNASHRRIDHCDPSDEWGPFESHPSRRWLDRFLKDVQSPLADDDESQTSSSQGDPPTPSQIQLEDREGEEHIHDGSFIEGENVMKRERENLFVDTFRFFHPKRKNAFTCWSTVTGARQTNFGTRIDYIIADERLSVDEFLECDIMPEFEGSDHCPVKATLRGSCSPAQQLHPLCAKFMPEFAGKQQKLSSFFQKVSPSKKFGMHEKVISSDSQKRDGGGAVAHGKRPGQSLGKQSKKMKTDNKPTKTGNIASFFMKKSAPVSRPPQTISENVYRSCSSPEPSIQDNTEKREQQNEVSSDELSQGNVTNTLSDGNSSTVESVPGRVQEGPGDSASGRDLEPKPKPKLSSEWRNLLRGPPPPPKCRGHKEPCVLRTVKKAGANCGKQFFVCCRPEGHKSNPEARCNHFEWVSKR